jgi:hypothetical protein
MAHSNFVQLCYPEHVPRRAQTRFRGGAVPEFALRNLISEIVITKEDALIYETGRCTLIGSFLFRLFPVLFVWKCNRAYARYYLFVFGHPLGSYLDLSKQLREAIDEYFRRLTAGETDKQLSKLRDKINDLDEKLKSIDRSIGQKYGPGGNYKSNLS